MLDYLEQVHVLPGRSGVVRSAEPSGGMLVEIDGRDVELNAFASDRLLVTVLD
jgi:hypothetical protein